MPIDISPPVPLSRESRPITNEACRLNNGSSIPIAGHGSMEKGWFFDPTENARIVTSLSQAIRQGLRLIDTAKVYANEEFVGRAVRESDVPREEITIITKLWNSDHHRVHEAFEESLQRLMLDYVDIFVMHWPCALADSEDGLNGTPVPIDAQPTFLETYRAMESLVGPRCRAIGVSNFTQSTLTTLLAQCSIKPVLNEIEIHPLFPQTKLVPWCQERDIAVVAWGPLAGGPVSDYGDAFRQLYSNASLRAISSQYFPQFQPNQAVGALLLSWLYSRGVVAIPHSSSVERILDNLRCLTRLSGEHIELLNEIHTELGGYKMLIEGSPLLWYDNGPGGRGRTLFGWTTREIGWIDESGEVVV